MQADTSGHTAPRYRPLISHITHKGWGRAAGTLSFRPTACSILSLLNKDSFLSPNEPNSVRQLLALFICLLVSYAMHGQTFTDDLRNIDHNGGSLEVIQSTELDTLVNEKELGKTANAMGNAGLANRNKRLKLKPGQTPTERVSGFRIQIYQGTGAEGNANAKKMQARARQAFPGFSTYVSLNGPRWVCRLGDFQTNEEAQAFLRRVRSSGISKTVSIVRSPIFVIY